MVNGNQRTNWKNSQMDIVLTSFSDLYNIYRKGKKHQNADAFSRPNNIGLFDTIAIDYIFGLPDSRRLYWNNGHY